MTSVFLGLGSNLGDREATLLSAIRDIENIDVRIVRRSSIWETEPMGIRDQPWFLNLVIEGLTGLPPRALLRSLQQIEVRLGRIRHADAPRNGPRTVDIDILLYGSLMIQEEGIEIPHPRMERRRFVLEPLIEIAPDLRHPVSGVLFSEILSCAEPETTRKLQG